MITIKELPNQVFDNKDDLFKALKDNKSSILAAKKMQTKYADAFVYIPNLSNSKGEAIKAGAINTTDVNRIKVKSVINTTNLFDSHSDVHVDGIWNKSVKEKKDLYLLQEHKMSFDHIITDDVKANVEETNFKTLGYDMDGKTQALVFESVISKDRNPYMFDQYAKGFVKNHSVGMRYVKMELAINSEAEWNQDEKAVWDKYYDSIANKEEVDEMGYFWAVSEAKIIEGSAVPLGSNWATPTTSTEAVSDTSKQTEPSEDTQEKQMYNPNLF